MELTEYQLADLLSDSGLRFRLFTTGFTRPYPQDEAVVVLSFEGEWRRSDGVIMRAIAEAALVLLSPDSLVYDFRSLDYTWGDEMVHPFLVEANRWEEDMPFPVAVAVSDRSREGLTSLVWGELGLDPKLYVFDTVEEALARVERRYFGECA